MRFFPTLTPVSHSDHLAALPARATRSPRLLRDQAPRIFEALRDVLATRGCHRMRDQHRTAMLSPDRSEPRAGELRRTKRRARGRAAGTPADITGREPAQSFDPNEPWDVRSAEALTRLY